MDLSSEIRGRISGGNRCKSIVQLSFPNPKKGKMREIGLILFRAAKPLRHLFNPERGTDNFRECGWIISKQYGIKREGKKLNFGSVKVGE